VREVWGFKISHVWLDILRPSVGFGAVLFMSWYEWFAAGVCECVCRYGQGGFAAHENSVEKEGTGSGALRHWEGVLLVRGGSLFWVKWGEVHGGMTGCPRCVWGVGGGVGGGEGEGGGGAEYTAIG